MATHVCLRWLGVHPPSFHYMGRRCGVGMALEQLKLDILEQVVAM